MTIYRFTGLTAPPTLEKRRDALEAFRTLVDQDDEAIRQRRVEIAGLRRIHGELVLEIQELRRTLDPRLRSYVMWRGDDEPSVTAANSASRQSGGPQRPLLRASPDDTEPPGWPAGTPDSRGGFPAEKRWQTAFE